MRFDAILRILRHVRGRLGLASGRIAALVVVATVPLLACTTGARSPLSVYQNEHFEAGETYSRLFDAGVEATCEAARRALLSQGYLLNTVRRDFVSATKNFQPEGDVHVEIVFHVVCVGESGGESVSTAYVSAVQDRYALKKSPNAATVGVAALGSLSIPLTASEDSLVKVASETIPAGTFYDRFFALMQRNLPPSTGGDS